MSGWDGWANNINSIAGVSGVAMYDPNSGAVWGRSGEFDCQAGLDQFDKKADGGDANCPNVNGKRFMFIRKTLDDDPCGIFKQGQDNIVTTKGPGGCKVAIFVKGQKPEPVVAKVTEYLKPHVQ